MKTKTTQQILNQGNGASSAIAATCLVVASFVILAVCAASCINLIGW